MPHPIQEQLRASGESSQKTASGNQSLRGPISSTISIFLCVIDFYINAHICKLLNILIFMCFHIYAPLCIAALPLLLPQK